MNAQTAECKATPSNKLPANYVFHTVWPRDKNENKLKDCHGNYVQKICVDKVKSVVFCCLESSICQFDPRKTA